MSGRFATRIQNRGRNRCARIALPVALAASAGVHAATSSCAADAAASLTYMGRAAAAARELRIPPDYPRTHRLRLTPEAEALADAGRDLYGRPLHLEPHAAAALEAMMAAARRQGIALRPLSGYRSFEYQRRLVRDKLRHGMPIGTALRINAAPGFSEHHSGCAVDLATPGSTPADAAFAGTAAYRWLTEHAGAYGFRLSYPAGNPHGIDFEPWHWRFTGDPRTDAPADAAASAPPHATPTSPGEAVRGDAVAATTRQGTSHDAH
jgi:D-alanyl-D-alanine carboxypeptidase